MPISMYNTRTVGLCQLQKSFYCMLLLFGEYNDFLVPRVLFQVALLPLFPMFLLVGRARLIR